jgi:hypothetical protein
MGVERQVETVTDTFGTQKDRIVQILVFVID